MLIQITSTYFCCGVVFNNERIIRCAPIVKYMLDWNAERFYDYCIAKHWELAIIPD